MTVHMFRCFIGRGKMSKSDLEARINDWVESNGEWVEDNIEHTLSEQNTEIDGSGETYYDIDVRFLKDNTKDNLQQKFTDKLIDKVGWYRVGYHLCYSDSDPHDLCGPTWGDSVEWTAKDVTIPSEVPDFPV